MSLGHVSLPFIIREYATEYEPENHRQLIGILYLRIIRNRSDAVYTTTLYTTWYTMVYKANSADSSLAQHKQERVCNVLLLIGHGRKEARQRIGTGFAYRLNGQLRLHGRLQGADTLGEAFKASQCCH
jgi:hypothetical protein